MTANQRLVLILAILSSFVAFLDGSIVSVALPQISEQLGGGLLIQQWVNDAYLITLGSLMLAAGSLSDNFGHRKMLNIGLVGFLVASLLCAVAPTGEFLVAARGLQGIAGALLVPSSLSMIIGAFSGAAQSKAIGRWTALTGTSFIVGPLLGGLLVDLVSWRLVFAINVIPIVAALLLSAKVDLDSANRTRERRIDIAGIVLGAIALGGIVYALIEQSRLGWADPLIWGSLAAGLLSLVAFISHERRAVRPMLPLDLFKNGNFSTGNIATLLIYAALSLQGFLLAVFLQQVAGYSATMAGLASLPSTIIMLLLASKFGELSGIHGPRFFMAAGPVVAGIGTCWLLTVGLPTEYWTQILPAVVLFGIGLSMTVAPLTSAVLGSIKPSQSGIASAVNNALARIAGLLSVAMVGLFAGNELTVGGFHNGILFCVVLFVFGGIVSAIWIRNPAVSPSPEK